MSSLSFTVTSFVSVLFLVLLLGGCSNGSAQAVYPGGDGSSPYGTQPVQRETDGAARSRQVDRNDQSLEGTSWRVADKEEIQCLELVSRPLCCVCFVSLVICVGVFSVLESDQHFGGFCVW